MVVQPLRPCCQVALTAVRLSCPMLPGGTSGGSTAAPVLPGGADGGAVVSSVVMPSRACANTTEPLVTKRRQRQRDYICS